MGADHILVAILIAIAAGWLVWVEIALSPQSCSADNRRNRRRGRWRHGVP